MHQTEQQYFFGHCESDADVCTWTYVYVVCVCVCLYAYIYDLRSNSQAQANAHTQNAPSCVHIDVINGSSCRVNEENVF